MVNPPQWEPTPAPDPMIGGYRGNAAALRSCYEAALAKVLTPKNDSVPDALIAAMPSPAVMKYGLYGAIPDMPHPTLHGEAYNHGIMLALPFIGGQLGYPEQLAADVLLDFIHDSFTSENTPAEVRAANNAAISLLSIIIPLPQHRNRKEVELALKTAWA